ncbi:MAG TPA: PaaI family thioesterase [Candidatus Thermoplasmatota archaeon]|nr:PaaI family thioesterase [Candidatus Thermoplasmatota archaeon]
MARIDEQIAKTLNVPLERAPVADLIGMELKSAGRGMATFTLRVDRRHHNPMGSVHGGILCDLADASMGVAVISTLGKDETFTTLELKTTFLRPVFEGLLTCEAKVVNRGKHIAYVEASITNEAGKLVARAVSTNMVISREGDPDAFHHKPRPV